MRLSFTLLMLTLVSCAPVVSPTLDPAERVEIGGVLVGETVLSGDYLLVTDLLIPEGSQLVITSGTTIHVRRAEVTKIDPEFLSSMTEVLVRGTLSIEGTTVEPVVIAPEELASSSDPAWAGLLLDKVTASSIQHVQISGAETGLLLISANTTLTDSLLENNRYGLIIQGGSPEITDNRIESGEAGLYVWNSATPLLHGNVVRQNDEEGVYIDRTSRPKSADNRSEANAIGLVSSVRPDLIGFQLADNVEAWRPLLVFEGAN